MLDFSQEQDQSEGVGVQIPDGSTVKVRMKLGDAGQYAEGHPSISKTRNGLLQLVVDLELVNCDGRDMRFERITLPRSLQTNPSLTQGQITACNIGGAQLKAILLACGNQAAQLQAWEQLNGLEFPVVVSGEWEESKGSHYWNNHFKKVVTQKDESYQTVMSGTDVLSDTPIPERPAQAQPQQQPWQGQQQPQQGGASPRWAGGGQQQTQTAQGGFPSESSGLDDVPF